MKSAKGKGGWVVCCLHTKYPILCSQYRQKRIHQNSATHRLPMTSFVTLGSLMERKKTEDHSITAESSEKSHKAWQIGWDMRYIQDDRWGRWCQRGPKLPPYPGKRRHVSNWGRTVYDGAPDGALLIFHWKGAVYERSVHLHWLKVCTELPNYH